MIRRPPRSTHCISSAASDVYKRQNKFLGVVLVITLMLCVASYAEDTQQQNSNIEFDIQDLLCSSTVNLNKPFKDIEDKYDIYNIAQTKDLEMKIIKQFEHNKEIIDIGQNLLSAIEEIKEKLPGYQQDKGCFDNKKSKFYTQYQDYQNCKLQYINNTFSNQSGFGANYTLLASQVKKLEDEQYERESEIKSAGFTKEKFGQKVLDLQYFIELLKKELQKQSDIGVDDSSSMDVIGDNKDQIKKQIEDLQKKKEQIDIKLVENKDQQEQIVKEQSVIKTGIIEINQKIESKKLLQNELSLIASMNEQEYLTTVRQFISVNEQQFETYKKMLNTPNQVESLQGIKRIQKDLKDYYVVHTKIPEQKFIITNKINELESAINMSLHDSLKKQDYDTQYEINNKLYEFDKLTTEYDEINKKISELKVRLLSQPDYHPDNSSVDNKKYIMESLDSQVKNAEEEVNKLQVEIVSLDEKIKKDMDQFNQVEREIRDSKKKLEFYKDNLDQQYSDLCIQLKLCKDKLKIVDQLLTEYYEIKQHISGVSEELAQLVAKVDELILKL
eukprot:TRINITY_DN6098_c0_g1_i2.p1 TRINITY_DN6098_c0_g1~~TRINITY_DN6098_c0_g1_i2.p1  ORF type:complete len:557 (+),score=152.79 TRINITY_DN6098_c0_g1_i2:940-2610(+)